MELTKTQKVFRALPFLIGLVTMYVALLTISDPSTRHIVAGIGLALMIAGVLLNFQTIRSRWRG
jgi:hypothetical protein